jgi:hypothetical protein
MQGGRGHIVIFEHRKADDADAWAFLADAPGGFDGADPSSVGPVCRVQPLEFLSAHRENHARQNPESALQKTALSRNG